MKGTSVVKGVISCAVACLAGIGWAGFFGENPPTFAPGAEFPGASGSLAVVSSDQIELKYDFSKGGHYVAALCPLAKRQTVGAFRAEFSHDVDVRLSVRIVDATGQTFVKTTGILSSEWERSVWIPGETGWMSWGGAGDKVFHQPAVRIDFVAENTTPDRLGGTVGMLRVRGVEVTDDLKGWSRPAFVPPHGDLSLEAALERIKTARARLAPAVAALEAKGLGAKSRASLATVDDFLAWIAEDRFQGKKERALREARELTLVAERAADRAEGVLAGRICDFPVPQYRLGSNVVSRAQVIGERVWPDGHADRGPVFFTGYGHFQRVRTEVAKLPPLGLNFLQMEFGVRQVLPTETSVGKWPLENFAKDAKRAEAANVGIAVLLSPHYWPEWTFKKWPDLKCGCYAGYCPYHPAAREVLNRYFETLLPQIRNSPAVHSIVLSNEPSTRPNPKCPRVRAAFTLWLERRYKGDIAAYNKLTGKTYASFGEVPVPAGVDNKFYSVELADFVRFNREYFAAWHRWMAGRVRALAPNIPVHVKIQANYLNWSDSNPIFYSIDPVAFGRMSDFNGNDAVVSSEEDGNGLWCANWWDMEAAYDMQRTVVDRPIVNTENHLQRDRSQGFYQPGAHSYAALWQNALHGQNGSALWCWERAFDDGQSDFNGLALDRPEAFEAYSHCALDLMRLADDLAALQNLPPRILILHSTAYFLDGGRTRFAAAHRAANFLGEPLGVVTEETLAKYGVSGSDVARPFDTARVLLVPKTDGALLPPETQRGIARFRAEGGVVLDDLPQQEHGLFVWLAGMRSKLPGITSPIAEDHGKAGMPVFGVETRGIRQGSRTLLSVCNWTRTARRVRLEASAKDLITGRAIPQECVVEPLQPLLLEMDVSVLAEAVSPDGRNRIRLYDAPLSFDAERDGVRVVGRAPIGMKIDGKELSVDGRVPTISTNRVEGTERTVAYRKAQVDLGCTVTHASFGDWGVTLAARNDGVAYRFDLRKEGVAKVDDETAGLVIPSSSARCSVYRTDRDGCEEEIGEACEAKDIVTPGKQRVYFPFLYQVAGKTVVVSESDVNDYPIWCLKRLDGSADGAVSFVGDFPRFPKDAVNNSGVKLSAGAKRERNWRVTDRADYLVETSGTRTFPWRTFVLADTPHKVIESDLNYALARPATDDFSWVRSGKVAWDWWNAFDNIGDPQGCTTKTYERFIDFAAKNGIEYVIFDEGWSEKLDIWCFNPAVDVPHLLAYARDRGVGIILWMAWAQVKGDEERVAEHFSRLGVKGFKVDFIDRGDADAERFIWKFAEVCAKNKLLLDYHGVHHPTGLNRRFPNVLNYEGVHGLEMMKFYRGERILENDVRAAFSRMTAGSLDYTPGAMDNYAVGTYPVLKKWDPTTAAFTNPGSLGTRSRQMAMLVLYEAPLQMLCDSPTKYEKNRESFAFMVRIPTRWKSLVALGGSPDSCVVLARLGDDGAWYVAGITNDEPRDVTVNLSFLSGGEWTCESFSDGTAAEPATAYRHTTENVAADSRLCWHMQAGGGFVMRLTRR